MSEGADSLPGAVDPELLEEFPGLKLRHLTVERGSGKSPKGLRERLRILSDRFAGPQAIAMRNQPIPWGYRVFYRHIGLDPDEQRTAVEQLALERMLKGEFQSRNLLDDALTVAIIESGVPVRAFDADRLEGAPGIRAPARPLALLFGAMAPGRGVSPDTTRTTLVAIGVSGVPDIAIEEALWLVSDAMNTA